LYITFDTNRIDRLVYLANTLVIDTADNLRMAPSLEAGLFLKLEIYTQLLIIQ